MLESRRIPCKVAVLVAPQSYLMCWGVYINDADYNAIDVALDVITFEVWDVARCLLTCPSSGERYGCNKRFASEAAIFRQPLDMPCKFDGQRSY